MKWYVKLLITLLVIIFSPLIAVFIIIAAATYLFQLPKNVKEYKKSKYYQEFRLPYATWKLYSPEYRFYNSFKKRNLKLTYVRQESNGFEYFIHNETLFLFPDFDQIDYDEEKLRADGTLNDMTWDEFKAANSASRVVEVDDMYILRANTVNPDDTTNEFTVWYN